MTMASKILIDSGPLVAFLASSEKYHRWVLEQLSELNGTLITTESVLSEVVFLLKSNPLVLKALQQMIDQHLLMIAPSLSQAPQDCFNMLVKYADLPASVADVSLTTLHETTSNSVIFTLDSDFLIYKTNSGEPLKLIAPFV